MEKISGIYKICCKKNGMIYIGQSNNIRNRINAHKNTLRNSKHCNLGLQHDWNFYGEDNFSFEIVENCSKEELNQKEIYWIEYYDCCDNGYNNTYGGDNLVKWGKESREKRSGNGNPFYGKKHTKEWKEKIKKSSTEVTRIPILQIDDNFCVINEYECITEASIKMNCSVTAISLCLRGINKKCKGYYWVYKKDIDSIDNLRNLRNEKKQKIEQIDPNTNEVICEYNSISDANYAMCGNRRKHGISSVLIGKQDTSFGYKWRRKEE